MATSDFLSGIERFLLDIFGYVIPGALAISIFTIGATGSAPFHLIRDAGATSIFTFALAAYVVGHAVSQLGGILYSNSQRERIHNQISERKEFLLFKHLAISRLEAALESDPGISDANVIFWRSYALSLPHKRNDLVVRFMQIANLNLGVATVTACALVVLVADLVGRLTSLFELLSAPPDSPCLAIGMCVSLVILHTKAHNVFLLRSLYLPFSQGIGLLTEKRPET